MLSRCACCLLACLGAGFAPASLAAGKIASELQSQAAGASRLRVLIVLRDQPQREILDRVGEASGFLTEAAEADYREAAGHPFVSEQLLAPRPDRLDALILQTRQAAAREIDFRIRPAQEASMARLTALGATNFHHYLVVNMIGAEIAPSLLAALEADPEVAEVLPMGEDTASLDVNVPVQWDDRDSGASVPGMPNWQSGLARIRQKGALTNESCNGSCRSLSVPTHKRYSTDRAVQPV